MTTVQEQYCYVETAGERLFTALHRPAATPARGIVLCHPLGEEKLWAHRVFVSFARDAAAAGVAVLRFDFRGEGDSDREFAATDLESRVADVETAVGALRAALPSLEEVCLVGLRFGACPAALAAARRTDIARLVLWDPVTDGAAYMQSVLRMNLMAQMAVHRKVIENRDALVARLNGGGTVNIEGYELGSALFTQTSAFRLAETLPPCHAPGTVVQIVQGEAPARADLAALRTATGPCDLQVVQEEPFWREIKPFCRRAVSLTQATLTALGGRA